MSECVPAEEKVQEAEAIPFSPLNFMELFFMCTGPELLVDMQEYDYSLDMYVLIFTPFTISKKH